MKAGFRTKEVNHLRNQLQLFVAREICNRIDRAFESNAAIARLENDALVGARFNAHARAQRKRKIYGRRAGMKKIQRPDVNRAACQIDARRSRGFDNHQLLCFVLGTLCFVKYKVRSTKYEVHSLLLQMNLLTYLIFEFL